MLRCHYLCSYKRPNSQPPKLNLSSKFLSCMGISHFSPLLLSQLAGPFTQSLQEPYQRCTCLQAHCPTPNLFFTLFPVDFLKHRPNYALCDPLPFPDGVYTWHTVQALLAVYAASSLASSRATTFSLHYQTPSLSSNELFCSQIFLPTVSNTRKTFRLILQISAKLYLLEAACFRVS